MYIFLFYLGRKTWNKKKFCIAFSHILTTNFTVTLVLWGFFRIRKIWFEFRETELAISQEKLVCRAVF